MPNSSIELLVDRKRVTNFLNYSIDADIYAADHAFSLDLVDPEVEIKSGLRCEIKVNGITELTGIIDRVTRSCDKAGRQLKVEGRDLMGLVVDSYCEEFITVQDMDIKGLAGKLLSRLPFINRKAIVYQENIVGNLKKKKGKANEDIFGEQPMAFAQIEPGQTIFEVLKEYARSRGMMFWGMPDGTFIFGRPMAAGKPTFILTTSRSAPAGNNILSSEEVIDFSKRYSKIVVIGQQQGQDTFGADLAAAEKINTLATLEDKEFPFYKPFVTTNNNDSRSPELEARMLLEKQRQEGYQLHYRVNDHEQNGANWAINTLCQVNDEALNVKGVFLIYGRTFELSRDGSFTSLRLGPPGVIQ